MNFTESIVLDRYADSASKQFDESESRLSQIEGSFETRMKGKTKTGIIGSMIGTIGWLVILIFSFSYIGKHVGNPWFLLALGVSLALIVSILIDEAINYSYYGKISVYKDNISQLKNRVSIGRNSIKANQDAYMKSRANGWNYVLTSGSSISEEAMNIENTINNMQSLKGGLINGLKNILFFAAAVSVTAVGSWALFEVVDEIVQAITGESLSNTWYIIGMVLAVICDVILAKKFWSKTDCAVTNITLFAIAAGPVCFLALVVVVTLIVMLVILVVEIFLAILGVCVVGAIAFGATSGG